MGKGQLKERCGLEKQNNFFPFKNSPKTECGLDSRTYGTRWAITLPRTSFVTSCRLACTIHDSRRSNGTAAGSDNRYWSDQIMTRYNCKCACLTPTQKTKRTFTPGVCPMTPCSHQLGCSVSGEHSVSIYRKEVKTSTVTVLHTMRT